MARVRGCARKGEIVRAESQKSPELQVIRATLPTHTKYLREIVPSEGSAQCDSGHKL